MRLFEFLFYCIYTIVFSIKDIREKREILASNLFYIPLYFNNLSAIFPLIVLSRSVKFISIPFYVFGVIIVGSFFGLKYFCTSYFIDKHNCERIIAFYKHKFKNKTAMLIGISYFILSFVLFVLSAKYSQQLRGL